MKKILILFSIFLLACGLSLTAQAGVLYFDDVTTSTGNVPLASSYGGFSWDSNWYVESDSQYTSSAYNNTYGSPSGDYAAFNAAGVLTVSIKNTADFDFNGAYFTGWADRNQVGISTSTSITIEGYDDGSLTYSTTASLSTDQYDWVNTSFLGIDELKFIASATGKWWLMDNFTYNETSVPEPATILLLGTGLIGLAGLRRRFIK